MLPRVTREAAHPPQERINGGFSTSSTYSTYSTSANTASNSTCANPAEYPNYASLMSPMCLAAPHYTNLLSSTTANFAEKAVDVIGPSDTNNNNSEPKVK